MSYRQIRSLGKRLTQLEQLKHHRCPNTYECKTNMAERAFRRGYQHGWLFALRAIEGGATPKELKDFAIKQLQDWRLSRANEIKQPPEFEHGQP